MANSSMAWRLAGGGVPGDFTARGYYVVLAPRVLVDLLQGGADCLHCAIPHHRHGVDLSQDYPVWTQAGAGLGHISQVVYVDYVVGDVPNQGHESRGVAADMKASQGALGVDGLYVGLVVFTGKGLKDFRAHEGTGGISHGHDLRPSVYLSLRKGYTLFGTEGKEIPHKEDRNIRGRFSMELKRPTPSYQGSLES